MRRAAAVAISALALSSCGGDDDDNALRVSAAASLREALTECTKDDGAQLSFGGSDELAAQIRNGARPDVYAAANTRLPEELAGEDLLETPVVFATNQLVIALPEGSEIAKIEDLAKPGVKLVIGSETVPVGAYTGEVLERLPEPVSRAILANVRSEEPDVKGIVGKLVQGAADAGFVYTTDVAAADELSEVALPDELEPQVAYGAGVVKDAENAEDAKAFVDGLVSGPCGDALREAGFGAPPAR